MRSVQGQVRPGSAWRQSVRVESLLGAAFHMQALVAQEVGVVQETFDAVPAPKGPCPVLTVHTAAVPRQVFRSLEQLPAVTALDAQPGPALSQRCIRPPTCGLCRPLLAPNHRQGPGGRQVDPPVAEQVRVEAEALPAGAAPERFPGLVGFQVPVQVLAVTEQLPTYRALVQLLLLPAAAQVSDEIDPPAEDLAAVGAHIGLPRGMHLAPHRQAILLRHGGAVLLPQGAPCLICAVGAQLGVFIPRAG